MYYANPLMELGLIFTKTGRLVEAETYLRLALDMRLRFLPRAVCRMR